MGHERASQRAAELVAELRLLAQSQGVWRADLIHVLNTRARNLRDLWGIDTEKGVEKARFTVRAMLNGYLPHLTPSPGNSPDKRAERAREFELTYSASFNLGPESSPLVALDLTNRRKWLRRKHDISNATATNDHNRAINEIVKVILNGRSVLVSSEEPQPEPAYANPNYVPRDALHREFADLVQNGAYLIALVGQPGMGKTWLARAVARLSDGSAAPMLRFQAGGIAVRDIQGALLRHDIKTHNLVDTDPRTYLTLLLCSDGAPKFVILDNLGSTDELLDVLPYETKSIVVATCREEGAARANEWSVIRVSEMEPHEALDVALRLLPTVDRSDVEQLVAKLHGYPLVLRYSCGLIAMSHMSIEEFCEDLDSSVQELADTLPVEGGATLLAVIRRLLESIEDRDALAYELLVLHSMFGIGIGCESTSANFLRWGVTAVSETVPSKIRFWQAVSVLSNSSLIEFDNKSVELGELLERDELLAMHPFIRSILFEEFSDRAVGICVDLVRSQTALLARLNEDDDEPSDEANQWIELAGGATDMQFLLGRVIIDKVCGDEYDRLDSTTRKMMEAELADLISSVDDILFAFGAPREWRDWARRWHQAAKPGSHERPTSL